MFSLYVTPENLFGYGLVSLISVLVLRTLILWLFGEMKQSQAPFVNAIAQNICPAFWISTALTFTGLMWLIATK